MSGLLWKCVNFVNGTAKLMLMPLVVVILVQICFSGVVYKLASLSFIDELQVHCNTLTEQNDQ